MSWARTAILVSLVCVGVLLEFGAVAAEPEEDDALTKAHVQIAALKQIVEAQGETIARLKRENESLLAELERLRKALEAANSIQRAEQRGDAVPSATAPNRDQTDGSYAEWQGRLAAKFGGGFGSSSGFDLREALRAARRAKTPEERRRLEEEACRKAAQLPRVAVGEYGRASFLRVMQVLGPDEMLASEINGARQVVYLKGFPTQGLLDGARWRGDAGGGFDIALIGILTYTTALGASNTVPYAVPLEWLRNGLTREQFVDMVCKGVRLEP